MNKNELVHLHALLARVAEDYVDRGLATSDDFATYHALGTTPMTLRRARADHEAATRVLAETLAALSVERPRHPASDAGGREHEREHELEEPTNA